MRQNPTPSAPYPTNDTPLTLPSGTVVRVRNIAGSSGKALTLYIETPTPADDSARVRREAMELLDLHRELAASQSLVRANVGVCRTRACLEMREIPSEMFEFVRQSDGSWRAARN